jgi:hypothetical protein
MSEDYHYYKDQVKDLQNINDFVKMNTINSIINKLEWLKKERSLSGLSNDGLEYAIEAVRAMR